MQHHLHNKRITNEEQVKKMGLILDFDDIARRGSMSKEEGLIAKWYGIYSSRQKGDHMARIVIPGGIITSVNARDIADMSDKYAQGKISVTTRQALQFHRLQIKDLPQMLRDLKKAGLSTFHGCGDVTRNVTACPWAKFCKHKRVDVMPYVLETAELLTNSRDLDNLPRKFKLNFSGCDAGCGQTYTNCVGANAVLKKNDDGIDELGFRVFIGGGLGWKPFIGQEVYSFVPADMIAKVSRGIGILFRDYGDRTSRKHARLKFVVDRLGIEKCRELLEGIFKDEKVDTSRFETGTINECGGDIPSRPLRELDPKDKDNLCIHRIMIPKGELSSHDFRKIADLSEIYGDKHIYTTNRQNLEIHGVSETKKTELKREVSNLSFNSDGFYGLQDVVSCVGTTYCPLAVTQTHELFDRLQSIVNENKYEPIREKILVNITGCPNSCGQHYIADIGFRGLRIRQESGSVEGYQIRVGGRLDTIGIEIGDYTLDDSVVVFRRILDGFIDTCKQNDYDSLSECISKEGVELC